LTAPDEFIEKYPILKYREDIHVRGNTGCTKCYLALDDMAVAGGRNGLKHFPSKMSFEEGQMSLRSHLDRLKMVYFAKRCINREWNLMTESIPEEFLY
jgi:hypothetical protein